jgi:hypothetical protein
LRFALARNPLLVEGAFFVIAHHALVGADIKITAPTARQHIPESRCILGPCEVYAVLLTVWTPAAVGAWASAVGMQYFPEAREALVRAVNSCVRLTRALLFLERTDTEALVLLNNFFGKFSIALAYPPRDSLGVLHNRRRIEKQVTFKLNTKQPSTNALTFSFHSLYLPHPITVFLSSATVST